MTERRLVGMLVPGVLLLLVCHVVPTMQLELYKVPTIASYPATTPTDKNYPSNIPAGLPQQLVPAELALTQGPLAACPVTVSAVLAANQRTRLVQYLAATPLGQQILSGAVQTTILAPPDTAFNYVLSTAENGLAGPKAANTLALYHVLQGKHSLAELQQVSGLYWNSSLTHQQLACPTASQTLTVLSAGTNTYARSATTTSRIVTADLAACNSVVHLVDSALQPCCVSLFEELPKLSIVKIQPSYFEGYAAQQPAGNNDGYNRRLFEEALVDLLLYTTTTNQTRTVLWPAPSAWDNINLASLLSGITFDTTTRSNAMRVLALYSISYAQSLLPKDIPSTDGTAPAVVIPLKTSLRNMTSTSLWSCSDTLSVSASAYTRPDWSAVPTVVPSPSPVVSQPGTTPLPSPSPTPNANLPNVPPAGQSPSLSPVVTSPVSSPSPIPVIPSPSPVFGVSEKPDAAEVSEQHSMRRLKSSTGASDAGHRKLQGVVAGPTKTVRVVNTFESCEGIRVITVDAVPIPCGFTNLVKNYAQIQDKLDITSTPKGYSRTDEGLYNWMLQHGVIQPGQALSGFGNAAGVTVISRLHLWLGLVVMAWLSWQLL